MVACISIILCTKVNKMDFKCLEGFLKKGVVFKSEGNLKIIKDKFNGIW